MTVHQMQREAVEAAVAREHLTQLGHAHEVARTQGWHVAQVRELGPLDRSDRQAIHRTIL
jgi:hypothetical protein